VFLTAPASIAEANGLKNPHRGGAVLERLTDLLTDLHTHAVVVWAGHLVGSQLILDPLVGQVLGESLPLTLVPAVAVGLRVL
jgi:hypothetical protein